MAAWIPGPEEAGGAVAGHLDRGRRLEVVLRPRTADTVDAQLQNRAVIAVAIGVDEWNLAAQAGATRVGEVRP
jgi:hypothetical protein